MFNLADVNETTGNLYITPGISEVTITSFESKNNRFDDPIIEVTFKTVDGTSSLVEELTAKTEAKDGKKSPMDMTMIKLRHIARAIIGEENLGLLNGTNMEEFIAACNTHLTNKPYRQKFAGQEIISNGKSWDKALVPLPGKEAMAEPLSVEVSKLTYDKNNSYDYRKKATVTVSAMAGPIGGSFGIPAQPIAPIE